MNQTLQLIDWANKKIITAFDEKLKKSWGIALRDLY